MNLNELRTLTALDPQITDIQKQIESCTHHSSITARLLDILEISLLPALFRPYIIAILTMSTDLQQSKHLYKLLTSSLHYNTRQHPTNITISPHALTHCERTAVLVQFYLLVRAKITDRYSTASMPTADRKQLEDDVLDAVSQATLNSNILRQLLYYYDHISLTAFDYAYVPSLNRDLSTAVFDVTHRLSAYGLTAYDLLYMFLFYRTTLFTYVFESLCNEHIGSADTDRHRLRVVHIQSETALAHQTTLTQIPARYAKIRQPILTVTPPNTQCNSFDAAQHVLLPVLESLQLTFETPILVFINAHIDSEHFLAYLLIEMTVNKGVMRSLHHLIQQALSLAHTRLRKFAAAATNITILDISSFNNTLTRYENTFITTLIEPRSNVAAYTIDEASDYIALILGLRPLLSSRHGSSRSGAHASLTTSQMQDQHSYVMINGMQLNIMKSKSHITMHTQAHTISTEAVKYAHKLHELIMQHMAIATASMSDHSEAFNGDATQSAMAQHELELQNFNYFYEFILAIRNTLNTKLLPYKIYRVVAEAVADSKIDYITLFCSTEHPWIHYGMSDQDQLTLANKNTTAQARFSIYSEHQRKIWLAIQTHPLFSTYMRAIYQSMRHLNDNALTRVEHAFRTHSSTTKAVIASFFSCETIFYAALNIIVTIHKQVNAHDDYKLTTLLASMSGSYSFDDVRQVIKHFNYGSHDTMALFAFLIVEYFKLVDRSIIPQLDLPANSDILLDGSKVLDKLMYDTMDVTIANTARYPYMRMLRPLQ